MSIIQYRIKIHGSPYCYFSVAYGAFHFWEKACYLNSDRTYPGGAVGTDDYSQLWEILHKTDATWEQAIGENNEYIPGDTLYEGDTVTATLKESEKIVEGRVNVTAHGVFVVHDNGSYRISDLCNIVLEK